MTVKMSDNEIVNGPCGRHPLGAIAGDGGAWGVTFSAREHHWNHEVNMNPRVSAVV
jgi:hypothetical protein